MKISRQRIIVAIIMMKVLYIPLNRLSEAFFTS